MKDYTLEHKDFEKKLDIEDNPYIQLLTIDNLEFNIKNQNCLETLSKIVENIPLRLKSIKSIKKHETKKSLDDVSIEFYLGIKPYEINASNRKNSIIFYEDIQTNPDSVKVILDYISKDTNDYTELVKTYIRGNKKSFLHGLNDYSKNCELMVTKNAYPNIFQSIIQEKVYLSFESYSKN